MSRDSRSRTCAFGFAQKLSNRSVRDPKADSSQLRALTPISSVFVFLFRFAFSSRLFRLRVECLGLGHRTDIGFRYRFGLGHLIEGVSQFRFDDAGLPDRSSDPRFGLEDQKARLDGLPLGQVHQLVRLDHGRFGLRGLMDHEFGQTPRLEDSPFGHRAGLEGLSVQNERDSDQIEGHGPDPFYRTWPQADKAVLNLVI